MDIEAHAGKLYYLGTLTLSNLSKDNEQRDCQIIDAYASSIITEVHKHRIDKIFELDGHVYALNSTTIDLCLGIRMG